MDTEITPFLKHLIYFGFQAPPFPPSLAPLPSVHANFSFSTGTLNVGGASGPRAWTSFQSLITLWVILPGFNTSSRQWTPNFISPAWDLSPELDNPAASSTFPLKHLVVSEISPVQNRHAKDKTCTQTYSLHSLPISRNGERHTSSQS